MKIGDRVGFHNKGTYPVVGTIRSFSNDDTWFYMEVDGCEGWTCVMPDLDHPKPVFKVRGMP